MKHICKLIFLTWLLGVVIIVFSVARCAAQTGLADPTTNGTVGDMIVGGLNVKAVAMFQAGTNPCTGSPQPAHCNRIVVTPAAAQPAGVVISGFSLYRTTTKGVYGATPYMTNTLPAGGTFEDDAVAQGTTVFYILRADCATCTAGKQQSANSNELTALTPTDVGPPSGATITIQVF